MALAIDKARSHGTGFVAARSSGEILTPYVRQAVDADMVGLVMVQSVPTVAPLGGKGPLLGNGPLAIGVPAGDHDPVIVDMSFTQSSSSGVLLAAEQHEQVPEGFVLDEHGQPTTDARDYPDHELEAIHGGIHARGTLASLGGNHKGYAMVYAVGLLTALLADASPPVGAVLPPPRARHLRHPVDGRRPGGLPGGPTRRPRASSSTGSSAPWPRRLASTPTSRSCTPESAPRRCGVSAEPTV